MCGIIAYTGMQEAYPILYNGLTKLEYRGYDSAGIAVLHNSQLTINKKEGEVVNLSENQLIGTQGIAHTRWATHGPATTANAHPHTTHDNKITIVHNGIIENYKEIKEQLHAQGYTFKSDTDTEVLLNLIHSKPGDLQQKVVMALKEVVGAYGIVVLDNTGSMIAAKNGSPLALGIGKNELYIASDPVAFLEHTRRVLYLEDGDIVKCTRDTYEFVEGDTRSEQQLTLSVSDIQKDGHEHFMHKEICEQVDSLAQTFAGKIREGTVKVSSNFSQDYVSILEHVLIIGCGTSYHAGLLLQDYIKELTSINTTVQLASDIDVRCLPKRTLVVAISQSGETADTLNALKECKTKGFRTFGIVNVVGSTIAREVESGIYIHAGPEISVASTKAFSGQTLAGLIFALHLRDLQGKPLDKQLLDAIQVLPEHVQHVIEREHEFESIAKHVATQNSCYYLGRGTDVIVSKEAALKLKEISYVHAEAYSSGEMKHGPIALIQPGFPIISTGDHHKLHSNIEECKARHAHTIHLGTHPCSIAHTQVLLPKTHSLLQPIVYSVAHQLIAYHTAKVRECSIDKPRNLAKTVTVE